MPFTTPGSTSDSLTHQAAGVQAGGLLLDVMTPHHGDYYGEKCYDGGPLDRQRIPPTDFDNPVPVAFLSVRGKFHFVLTSAYTTADGRAWLQWTVELLEAALADWGVGGKTSSGYGRLTKDALAAFEKKPATDTAAPKPTSPVAGGGNAPQRQTGAAPDREARGAARSGASSVLVRVKVLESHSKLPGAYFVQEAGGPRGLLQHGRPPATPPQPEDEIEVYRKAGCDPKSPVYRWTPEEAAPPRRSGPPHGGKR